MLFSLFYNHILTFPFNTISHHLYITLIILILIPSGVPCRYIDPNSGHHALKRLNANLIDIQGIMHQNIQSAIGRGESLDRIENKTHTLLNDSKAFKEQARYTNLMAMMKQYAPLVAVVFIVLFVIIWRFW